jgi:hypothetical protein
MAHALRPQVEGDVRLWRIRGELELLYMHLRNRDWERARRILLIIRDNIDAMIDEGLQCTVPTSDQ